MFIGYSPWAKGLAKVLRTKNMVTAFMKFKAYRAAGTKQTVVSYSKGKQGAMRKIMGWGMQI